MNDIFDVDGKRIHVSHYGDETWFYIDNANGRCIGKFILDEANAAEFEKLVAQRGKVGESVKGPYSK